MLESSLTSEGLLCICVSTPLYNGVSALYGGGGVFKGLPR